MTEELPERILCAAIWIDDGEQHTFQPTETGIVVCGWRHHACISTAHDLGLDPKQGEQGFLTSAGRFVGRREAKQVARDAGQIEANYNHPAHMLLFSEDLY